MLLQAALAPFTVTGRLAIGVCAIVGALAMFIGRTLLACLTPRWHGGQIVRQAVSIGFLSLPVVGLTAVFTGAALALNIYTGGGRFNAEQIVPQIVALGITRELAPVLVALMLSGRVATTIAAEIGAMRATEQIDAMRTLSTDPFRFLVAPRVLAGVATLPLLTGVADIVGIAGGWVVSTWSLGFSPEAYARSTVAFLEAWDVQSGLIKAAVFGFIVTAMGAFHGYRASGGARGVGHAATQAMVWSGVLIFATDYLMTSWFTEA